MCSTTRRDLIGCVLGAAAALFPTGLRADRGRDHGRDHEHARRAVERGEALPLAAILARVRSELGGEVVGVSFERKRDRWIYEFKVIGPGGRLVEVYVDAASAQVLKREEH